MERSTLNIIHDNIKRLGHNSKCKTFREIINDNLTSFQDPIPETVNGVDYLIVAGFFNIFFIFLVYYCPSTEKYIYYGIHRDSDTIHYKTNFPEELPTFSTFNEIEEHIYELLKSSYGK